MTGRGVAAHRWDVVVVGGANTDYVARGPVLPQPGQSVQGDLFVETMGGKGVNGAIAAARLGARVALVARMGADPRGDKLIARLRDEGVDTQYVVRDAVEPTGVAVLMVDAGGRKGSIGVPGANSRLSVSDVQAARCIAMSRVVLMQLEAPVATVEATVALGRAAGARIVLDPAPPVALPDALLRQVDVIMPNADEAMALTGVRVTDCDAARAAASALLAHGVGLVVVEAGEEGTLLVWRNGERLFPRISVATVDTTGAGDAFAGALAVALAEGRTLLEAAPFAQAAAAIATTGFGALAALPRRDSVLALLSTLDGITGAP